MQQACLPGKPLRMENDVGTVERAFELAASGRCATMAELRRQLQRENFASVNEHLASRSLRRQLDELILRSRAGVPDR
jgi:hypothetical protein